MVHFSMRPQCEHSIPSGKALNSNSLTLTARLRIAAFLLTEA
jgi:hypothetical protein